ncbi:DUF397 domain-containing protein [Actinomadura madurae]|uniref:DUF397 domain-containing protein n=1 Tax=Actinomadura madurae TaxID=1993 RepID=UPI000943EEF7|nr:DUF397 domain-containing protein [Actinomadura madurae]
MKTQYSGWHKSSHSAPDGDCVEVGRSLRGTVGVRDSKRGDGGDVLEFSGREWASFLQAVRSA